MQKQYSSVIQLTRKIAYGMPARMYVVGMTSDPGDGVLWIDAS